MQRSLIAAILTIATAPALSQNPAKYQVATIIAVEPHQPTSNSEADKNSYEVSLKIEHNIYVVLYTPVADTGAVQYASGRDVLVLLSEKTIKFSDLAGTPLEAPILSKKPAESVNNPK